jgi:hypothetical protein
MYIKKSVLGTVPLLYSARREKKAPQYMHLSKSGRLSLKLLDREKSVRREEKGKKRL